MKTLAYIICYIIYPFSFLIPRSRKKLAFGSFRNGYADNSKYLFEYAVEHGYDATWLSASRKTVQAVRAKGLPAEWILSPRGVWKALRAKYWFVNSYTSDILFSLSGNAIVVNLWHGVGLKRCEFNITTGTLAKRYVDHSFKEVFFHPECFRRPDYLISSTPFQSEMFSKAFRIPLSRCLNLGYPRNMQLMHAQAQQTAYHKVYLYMPTWRDSQLDVFAQHFDLEQLEEILAKQNSLMWLKPHPNTKVESIKDYQHIKLIDRKEDVYGLFAQTDVLITDYSSVLYDYILLEGRDVILYLYDQDEYIKDRDFYYPFEENTCGKRCHNWEELIHTIQNEEYRLEPSERQRILDKFWGASMKGNVCQTILDAVL